MQSEWPEHIDFVFYLQGLLLVSPALNLNQSGRGVMTSLSTFNILPESQGLVICLKGKWNLSFSVS